MAELIHGLNKIYRSSGTYECPDGELVMTGQAYLRLYHDDGTVYIPVEKDNMLYYYDFIFSNDSGNQLYIGVEKTDSAKTSSSNDSCHYILNTKAKQDHVRVKGSFTLTNDANGKPVRYIRIRFLNQWTGSVTGATCGNVGKIHFLSIREVPNNTLKITSMGKNGVTYSDSFRTTYHDLATTKDGGAHIYDNGFMGATDFYEF